MTIPLRAALLAVWVLAGLHWLRSSSVVPRDAQDTQGSQDAKVTQDAPKPVAITDAARIVLLAAGDPQYQALAIPKSYKTSPDAPNHLLVFRGGFCVRDIGLADAQKSGEQGTATQTIVEEKGTTARGFVASDGLTAAILRTHYVSRVDMTPGQKSTAGDTVTGGAILTLIDPTHPDGRWRVTLENSRWAKDVVVLSAGKGVALTTFLPRNGPADIRILDATGHESLHVPESAGDAVRLEASPDGGYVAAELAFRDNPALPERGVVVFDIAAATQWTYGWRYGSDAEPVSWTLQAKGVLFVKLPKGTRRFDARGKKL